MRQSVQLQPHGAVVAAQNLGVNGGLPNPGAQAVGDDEVVNPPMPSSSLTGMKAPDRPPTWEDAMTPPFFTASLSRARAAVVPCHR